MNDNRFHGRYLIPSWAIEKLTIEVDWQTDQFHFISEIVGPPLRLASVRSPNANRDAFQT